MCGIVGVYARDGSSVDPAQVLAMRDTMIHRGPDDDGLWARPSRSDVVLGHRRLSIVDLSPAGRQPMGNEDGSVRVVFNGEIYNHADLRCDLEASGHVFRSRCDTEVLVHLYEEHRERMVDLLVGMFTFAVWDERRERLLLARDRLGIKPLYWLDDGRRFAFASEIKALLPLIGRHEVDPVAFGQYLTFVSVPPPRTLFAGISKLAPASTLAVDRRGVAEPTCFWDPVTHRARLEGDEIDWEAELRFRLERSVQRRMMSDVPVGVFLSGGVDSSTNVALISRFIDQPVNTFSIGFEERDKVDELHWARLVAERFHTNHHEIRISDQDLWSFLPDLVHHQDEPIADPVCVPLYYVSRLAKDHGVTVVHVGEGADELLAGYPTYVTAYIMASRYWPRLRKLPSTVRGGLASLAALALPFLPQREIELEALQRAARPDGELWWGGAVAFYEQAMGRIATQSLMQLVESPENVVHRIASDARANGAGGELAELIYQDLRLRLPELLLMRVDKLTMASSVEARVPFLDHELVELAMAMPTDEKIRSGVGKHVLKRACQDLLPPEIPWRPKQGFGTPVARWFRAELGDRLERQLSMSSIHELGWLDRGEIDRLLRLHRSGRADRSFQLWNLLNASVWFDHWIAGRDVANELPAY